MLGPLGLDQTSYAAPYGDDFAAGAPGDDVERGMLATGEPYPVPVATSAFDGWRARVRAGEVDDGNAFHAFGGVAGHAGLFSTAGDLLRLGRGAAGLAARVGAVATYDRARRSSRPARTRASASASGRGGRPAVTARPTCSGIPASPGSVAGVLPDHDACVVLLTNRLHVRDPLRAVETDPLWRAVLDDAHDALHHQPTAEV